MLSNNPFVVNFYFKKSVTLQNRKRLKEFIVQVLKVELGNNGCSINCIFCSDEELLKINKDFLQHDFYTDIVTFELSEPKSSFLEAELYISVDRVKYNAKDEGVAFNIELHRVIFHGILHLCGLNDKQPNDIVKMRRHEDILLGKYFS